MQVAPERLAQLNRGLRGMKVGNFEYSNEELRLGTLKGNQFEIVMRNVTGASDDEVGSSSYVRNTCVGVEHSVTHSLQSLSVDTCMIVVFFPFNTG